MKRLPLALTFGCTAAMALLAGCSSLPAPAPAAFTLTSPDIAAGSTIANTYVLNGFGCKGQNVSPALVWSNPPAGTKSFAVQVYDPDAPTGSGFWHWTVYNIPASVTSLKQGAGNSPAGLPAGDTTTGVAVAPVAVAAAEGAREERHAETCAPRSSPCSRSSRCTDTR